MQTLLLLVAPALLAASMYMILGRIILVTDSERHSLVRKRWLTKIFVTGDIFSFLVQCLGGGVLAGNTDDPETLKRGENIIIAGLFLQLAFFSFFLVVGGIWKTRLVRNPTQRSLDPNMPWQKHFVVLMVASAFIFVRSLFRAIEYITGQNGYLMKHEIFVYIFDALLMALTMVLYNVVHPSEITVMLKGQHVMDEGLEI